MWVIVLCIVFTLLLAYVLGGRAWLKSKPWMAGFFAFIEPVEIFLFKKSETILFARLKIVTGLLLTLLAQLGTIDLTPLWPLIPDEYEGPIKVFVNLLPLTLTMLGWIDEKLRNSVSAPLEIVALAEKDKTPEVVAAVAVAEAAKVEAVAAVEVAKATPP